MLTNPPVLYDFCGGVPISPWGPSRGLLHDCTTSPMEHYTALEMILTSSSRVTSAPRPRWGRLWRGWRAARCCGVEPCFSNFRFNFSSFMLGYKWQIFSAVFIIHWHNEIQFLYNSTCALWRSFNSGNILFCQVQADLCAAQFSKRLSAIKMFIFSSPAARHFMLFRLKLVDHFPPWFSQQSPP